jgi:hypothetical protein
MQYSMLQAETCTDKGFLHAVFIKIVHENLSCGSTLHCNPFIPLAVMTHDPSRSQEYGKQNSSNLAASQIAALPSNHALEHAIVPVLPQSLTRKKRSHSTTTIIAKSNDQPRTQKIFNVTALVLHVDAVIAVISAQKFSHSEARLVACSPSLLFSSSFLFLFTVCSIAQ